MSTFPQRRGSEEGFAILFSIIVLGMLLLTVGSLMLAISLKINNDSYQLNHQAASTAAAQSGLEDALVDIKARCNGVIPAGQPCSLKTACGAVPSMGECFVLRLDHRARGISPGIQNKQLGDACYQYWFGRQSTTPTSVDGANVVYVHVLAASPYKSVESCDLRNVVTVSGGNNRINKIDGKLIAYTAVVDLSSATSGNYTLPRVTKVRWSRDYEEG